MQANAADAVAAAYTYRNRRHQNSAALCTRYPVWYPGRNHPYKSDLTKLEYNFHERSFRLPKRAARIRGKKRKDGGRRGKSKREVRKKGKREREELREKSLSLSKPPVEDEANQVTAVAYVRCTPKSSPREHRVETRYLTESLCLEFSSPVNYVSCHGVDDSWNT